ncbi:hypothetical protein J1605_006060 [Eschrichtius robustus]|uniref:Uncharacterized protein n=1 Tax=Eschrichtius robustus TaxID=9764 RepID=A0AB34H4I7_ESCRO|nr:hypothetical protein J1605_006060 [Eschrichtius robustus]
MGPVVFRWQQDGSLALTWVEATFFRPHLAIPATRGRPSLARGTAPSPVRAVHLAPPPEEGTGDHGYLGGSPASSGESLRGAEDRGPSSFGRTGPGGGLVGDGAGQGRPGRTPGAGKRETRAGRKAGRRWLGFRRLGLGVEALGTLTPGLRC